MQQVRVPCSPSNDPSYLDMRKAIPAVFFLALVPLVASALTIEDIKVQIQGILDRIEILKTQVSGGTGSATSSVPAVPTGLPCLSLARALSLGSRGDDVRELQKFLIAAKLLASDSATGYFGPLTEAAVQRFQTLQDLVSSGGPATTGFGFVGPKTREAILKSCAKYGGGHTSSACPKPPSAPLSGGCAGTWKKGSDANGCFTGYQCVLSSLPNQAPPPAQPSQTVPSITITEPAFGGIVTGGNTLNVVWRSEASPRAYVSLTLLDTEGQKIGTIAQNLSSSGVYVWSVPSGESGCGSGENAFDCITKFTRCEGSASLCAISPGTYSILATLSNGVSTTSAPFQIAGTAITDLLQALVSAPTVPSIPVSTTSPDGPGTQAGMCMHEGASYPVGSTLSVPCVPGHCPSTGTGFINGACTTGGTWCIPYTTYCAEILTLIDVSAYEGGGAAPIESGYTSNCPQEGWRVYLSCTVGSCKSGYHICRSGTWVYDPVQTSQL